jgi:hypothetical protein
LVSNNKILRACDGGSTENPNQGWMAPWILLL